MGVFDTIRYRAKCPYCGADIELQNQIKWTNPRRCRDYTIGDKIPASDGLYGYATIGRPCLYHICTNCNKKIFYICKVKEGTLAEIKLLKEVD